MTHLSTAFRVSALCLVTVFTSCAKSEESAEKKALSELAGHVTASSHPYDDAIHVPPANVDSLRPDPVTSRELRGFLGLREAPSEAIQSVLFDSVDGTTTKEVVKRIPLLRKLHPFEQSGIPVTESPVLVSLVPESPEEFKSVYKTDKAPGVAQSSALEKYMRTLSSLGGVRIDSEVTSVDQLQRRLEELRSKVLIVVAHSTGNGSMIHLIGGPPISLTDLHAACDRAGKTCLTLTCYSRDFRFSDEITAQQALTLWQSAIGTLGQQSSYTVGDLIETVNRKYAAMKQRSAMIQLAWIGVGVGGTAELLYSSNWVTYPPPARRTPIDVDIQVRRN